MLKKIMMLAVMLFAFGAFQMSAAQAADGCCPDQPCCVPGASCCE